jgi:hypothetical protein
MNENPFEQSTLASTPLPGDETIEVRFPQTQRIAVPGALLLSAVVVPIVMFFVLPPPQNVVVAAIVALMEFSTAGFLWFLFNSAFVRADGSGVTRSQMGQSKTVRWEEIAGVETKTTTLSRPPQTQYTLKDPNGKTLLQFTDFGNRAAGRKLADYIERRIETRRH